MWRQCSCTVCTRNISLKRDSKEQFTSVHLGFAETGSSLWSPMPLTPVPPTAGFRKGHSLSGLCCWIRQSSTGTHSTNARRAHWDQTLCLCISSKWLSLYSPCKRLGLCSLLIYNFSNHSLYTQETIVFERLICLSVFVLLFFTL